ncbi:arachidonate 5-lipoxygenase-like [Actinia tenebrosa]|uniref:Arachidonate 5-lipoxygenase-like n=1 Tax=Actinia tenebrosa TaxID=6105 RepID=A0A6P8IGY7_ACTTE|nr:arachidonate 5-lipoxygenase-like [Actinia tenebrosa]
MASFEWILVVILGILADVNQCRASTSQSLITAAPTNLTSGKSAGPCSSVTYAYTSECQTDRENYLRQTRTTYQLSSSPLGLFPVISLSSNELTALLSSDPLNGHWMKLYKETIFRNLKLSYGFIMAYHDTEFTTLEHYNALFNFFVDSQHMDVLPEDQKYFKFHFKDPSIPFKKLSSLCKWKEDKYFTEQRLAGINPMSIQRVTYNSIGVHANNLLTRLNTKTNWDALTYDAIGYSRFQDAIANGYVYILQYPEYDGLKTRPEPTSSTRQILNATSPITIFFSKRSRIQGKPNELIPVAIQMGHTADSPVVTPDNPDAWLAAKLTVQSVDFAYGQTVEHLLKTHLFMEPICVCLYRQLHKLHPLHQILKYHCRGILGTNKFGFPYLVHSMNGTMEKLYTVGYNGAQAMLLKAMSKVKWEITDFKKNIKDRGMDDTKKIPYYPYRDDGYLIYDAIEAVANEYIDLYYKTDYDVYHDKELQTFANEVSSNGQTTNGMNGKIVGFPYSIRYKFELKDILTRLIWMTSAQHSAVNYPSNYYAAYTPNMPSKLYSDSRVMPGDFDVANLPGMYYATIQTTITMTLTAMHFDSLFDYGNDLVDPSARDILYRHSGSINGNIKSVIESRNLNRLDDGHLPYPYLLPGWISNSIHT